MKFVNNVFKAIGEIIMSIATGRMPRSKKGGKSFFLLLFLIILILCAYFILKQETCTNCNNESESETETLKSEDYQKETTTSATEEETNLYLVTRVVDGDTFEIESGEKVRLIGVNTPESVDPNSAVECYGKEASSFLKNLLENRFVKLEKDVSETDIYSRLLRYVYLDDLFVNEYLVNEGYAYATAYPPDIKYQSLFELAEESAEKASRGLWSDACKINNDVEGTSDSTCQIKGNISWSGEKIYHLPECSYYDQTQIVEGSGEQYFCTEEEAIDDGFRKAANCPE